MWLIITIVVGHVEVVKFFHETCGPDLITFVEADATSRRSVSVSKRGQGKIAHLREPIVGDSLLHTAARSGQLGSLKFLWDTLKQRHSISVTYGFLNPGQFIGNLTDEV